MKLIKQTIYELKKVSFPTKKQTFKDTSVVLSVCTLTTAFVFLVDTLLQTLLKLIVR